MNYTSYITPDTDKFVVVDMTDFSSSTYSKTSLTDEVNNLQSELDAIPADPTDEELLAWARDNYPRIDYSVKRNTLQTELNKKTSLLASINTPIQVN